MTPQQLQTESFELVRAPGERIAGSKFRHDVAFSNIVTIFKEGLEPNNHFRRANAADKMTLSPCLVSTTSPSPTEAAGFSTASVGRCPTTDGSAWSALTARVNRRCSKWWPRFSRSIRDELR